LRLPLDSGVDVGNGSVATAVTVGSGVSVAGIGVRVAGLWVGVTPIVSVVKVGATSNSI